jgi:hypothetical protein
MAYAKTRSLQAELAQGEIDGSYKQINPDRGGVVETMTAEARRDLSPRLYGIAEAEEKELPTENRDVRTPYTVDGFDIPKIDRRD